MSEEEQQVLLAHCRHHGIWIITDEVYARLCRGRQVAPSFQHIASPDDRIISINSFSKAWSMTGWRLGWISAPAELETVLASLTEFNIACPAGSIQAAGEAMLKQGEDEVHLLQHRIDKGFQIIKDRLGHHQRISLSNLTGRFMCCLALTAFATVWNWPSGSLRLARSDWHPGRPLVLPQKAIYGYVMHRSLTS